MRLYIATPINARKEKTMPEKLRAARHRVELLKEILKEDERFKDYTIWSTFGLPKQEDENVALAQCVCAVLRADAIYLDHGWQGSKGCNLEYRAAKIYGKTIYEHDKMLKQQ